MRLPAPTRRWLLRSVALLVVLSLLAPSAVSAATYEPSDFRRGTIERPAEGVTVVSIQGFHFEGKGSTKKPARLVAFDARGNVEWVHNGSETGARWFYDVDPLPDGNLLVVATKPGETLVYALSPPDRVVWMERLPIHDTHDVDLVNGDQLLVANMRNYNESADRNDDRVFLYDRGSDEIVWEWSFRDHYPEDGGGKYTDDWTHVNDVDELENGRYLVSPRNFDQVIVVNRSTDEIEMRLGADDAHEVIHEQHNPVYLEAADGTPTIIVADSENDRVVEYERTGGDGDGNASADGGEWRRTWTLEGGFSWPRDADRLPSGNTLIVDSLNHRVVEVAPDGRIVWEVYAPWGPYDAERIPHGDEAYGEDRRTISDMGAEGRYELSGSAGLEPGTGDRVTFAQWLSGAFAGTPVESQVEWFAARWAHVTPWIYPVWMTGWDFAALVGAGLVALAWGAAELVVARGRVAEALRRTASGIRRHVP